MLCDPVSCSTAAGCIKKDVTQTDELVQAFRPKTSIKPSIDEEEITYKKFLTNINKALKSLNNRDKKHKTSAYPFEASKIYQTAMAGSEARHINFIINGDY
jgi:hypothetical protein